MEHAAVDLDALLHEGDASTWSLEDWCWDSVNVVAAPRAGGGCAATAAGSSVAVGAGACGAPATKRARHDPALPQQQHQQLQHQQLLLQQQQHQPQQQQQQQQQQQLDAYLTSGAGGAPWAPAPAPAARGQCHALAHGLPYLPGALAERPHPYPQPQSEPQQPQQQNSSDADSASAADADAIAAAAAAAAAITAQPPAVGADTPVLRSGSAGAPDDAARTVCSVPGCGADLSGLKDYHRRYQVCDTHLKQPAVLKDGRLMRFCQQCGRLHDLSAFDGARKSCREQLQKHNARRRRRTATEQGAAAAEGLLGAALEDDSSDVGKLLQQLMKNPFQLQAMRLVLGLQTHPALPVPAPAPWEHAAALAAAAGGGGGGDPAALPLPPPPPAAPPAFDIARAVVDGAPPYAPPAFDSEHRALRLSAKLFNVTPADLPPDLRGQLTGWLATAPPAVEAFIRPGCVLLSLHLTLPAAEAEAARRDGMARLLRWLLSSPAAHPFWRAHVYVLQLAGAVAVVAHGRVASLAPTMGAPAEAAAHRLPRRLGVAPLCLVAGRDAELTLTGSDIAAADATVVVKGLGGRHLLIASASGGVASSPACSGGGGSGACCGAPGSPSPSSAEEEEEVNAGEQQQQLQEPQDTVRAVLPAAPEACGLLWAEVARGSFACEARAVLVVDDAAVAREINAAAPMLAMSDAQVDALLADLAVVLAHIRAAAASSSSSSSPSPAGCGGGHHAAPQPRQQLPHAAIASKARRLLALACDRGWVAVAAAVLPLVDACGACSADGVVAGVEAVAAGGGDGGGLTLLHRAVRSGSATLVAGLLRWGAARGYRWRVASGGPGGVSPLHLASLLDDGGAITLQLLDALGGEDGWRALTEARAGDGATTPFHLAFQQGRHRLDRVLAALGPALGLGGPAGAVRSVVEQAAAPSGLLRLKAAAAAAAAAAASATSAAATTDGGTKADGSAAASSSTTSAADRALRPKERTTSRLDACLTCMSTLPPLLLAIKARCAGCGERTPCLLRGDIGASGGGAATMGEAADAAAAAPAPPPQLPQPAAAAGGGSASGGGCAHASGRVLQVAALCPGCHGNRVLEVA